MWEKVKARKKSEQKFDFIELQAKNYLNFLGAIINLKMSNERETNVEQIINQMKRNLKNKRLVIIEKQQ